MYLKCVGYLYLCDRIVIMYCTNQKSGRWSHGPQAMVCHGFEAGVLAGKLCVPDAQMPNAVYVPTPRSHTLSCPIS
jgi:hypothetical protein